MIVGVKEILLLSLCLPTLMDLAGLEESKRWN
jgi:hypothetical protein